MSKQYILTLLLLFNVCYGQSDSGTIFYITDTTGYPILEMRPQLDTVKVLLLVSDTSDGKGDVFTKPIHGYSVRKKYTIRTGDFFTISKEEDYFEHIKYLGKNLLPLPKRYVVWFSKDLNSK